MVSFKDVKAAMKAEAIAVKNYLLNPTEENEQAMLDAKAIVVMVIGVYIMSALVPAAISAINNASTVGWTTTQIAIWGVVGILIIAVLIIKLTE